MTPTFTVLIGSAGRDTLRDTLDSIARQERIAGDQVIVAIDSFEQGDRPDVQRLVRSYGPGFNVCAHDSGYHWYGIEQINWAMTHVPMTGTHVFTLGDDDVFVDGAYAALRPLCADHRGRALLYRFVAPWRLILWDHPRMQRSHISGCCIAAPTEAVGLFPTRQYVEHDYDWMLDILAKTRQDPIWLDHVMVIARPEARGDDVTHQGIVRCWNCKAWRYREDVTVVDALCPTCKTVIPAHELRPLTMASSYQGLVH